MNLDKIAKADAERWAAAEMFYGEGAGTRRKLVGAEIETRSLNVPGYLEAFNQAYQALDMDKFAAGAIKERQRLDRAAKVGQNMRAFKNGNIQHMSNGIFIIVAGVYVVHATGFDKVVEAEAKKLYRKARTEVRYRRARAKGKNVTKIV